MNKQLQIFLTLLAFSLAGSVALVPYVQQLTGQSLTPAQLMFSLVQQAIIYSIIIYVGLSLAKKLQLNIIPTDWRNTIKIGIITGSFLGILLLIITLYSGLYDFGQQLGFSLTSVFAPLLYGPVNEEVMCRLFLMPVFMYLVLKIGFSRTRAVYIGIILAAILFAAGHIPTALAVEGYATSHYVISFLINSFAGIIFGLLFYRYSLVAAMIAHGTVNIIVHVLPRLYELF